MRNIVCYIDEKVKNNNNNHLITPQVSKTSNLTDNTQCKKINIANFYNLIEKDSPIIISPGAAIEFTKDGVSNNTDIKRITSSTFNLTLVGIYEISFQITTNSIGQLVVVLNETEIPYAVFGNNIGGQIIGSCIITTTSPNSIISINNIANNSSDITIMPTLANLIIKSYIFM